MVADPEHRMLAVDAVQRGAAGAGLALIARAPGWIAEIIAPGALQYIAAERGHVADSRAGRELEGLRHSRVTPPDVGALSCASPRRGAAELASVGGADNAGTTPAARL